MSEKEQKMIDQPSQESAGIRPEVPTKSFEQEERPREPSQRETANMIVARLGETEESIRQQFVSIVKAPRRTQAHALFEQTLQIEQNGGMMLPDHSRRRTPGGVFFYLASTTAVPKEGKTLKRPSFKKPKAKKPKTEQTPSAAPAVPPPPFTWEDRIAVLEELQAEKETASAKIMLMGKLEKYVDKGTYAAGVLQSERCPSMPKGLPARPESNTNSLVSIGSKQWKIMAGTLSDLEDELIIEGYPQVNTQTGAVAGCVTSVASKKLQAAKRENQQKEEQV